jgi:protein gp37
MTKTSIEWTDATINPFFYLTEDGKRAFTCMPVSAACANCYAMTMEARFKGKKEGYLNYSVESVKSADWHRDYSAIAKAKPGSKNFISSMTEVFGDWLPREWQVDLLSACAANPDATFQILTKWPHIALEAVSEYLAVSGQAELPSNIWMGVTSERQMQQWRIDKLKLIPSKVRFVSIEPILEAVDFDLEGIHWVIVGGESGAKYRKPAPEWIKAVRDQCREEGIPLFFKQWGGRTSKSGGRLLDNEIWSEFPNDTYKYN